MITKQCLCKKTLTGCVGINGTVEEIFTKDKMYIIDFVHVLPLNIIILVVDNQNEKRGWTEETIREHFDV
jgi:hypothetical protein